jgi:hypothetical protein
MARGILRLQADADPAEPARWPPCHTKRHSGDSRWLASSIARPAHRQARTARDSPSFRHRKATPFRGCALSHEGADRFIGTTPLLSASRALSQSDGVLTKAGCHPTRQAGATSRRPAEPDGSTLPRCPRRPRRPGQWPGGPGVARTSAEGFYGLVSSVASRSSRSGPSSEGTLPGRRATGERSASEPAITMAGTDDHDRAECVITMRRNERSGWRGIRSHRAEQRPAARAACPSHARDRPAVTDWYRYARSRSRRVEGKPVGRII